MKKTRVTLFILILICPLLGLFFNLSPALDEKRLLAIAPTLSLKSLKNKSYFKQIETYFNDHFVFRSPLIRSKTWIDYRLFNTTNPKAHAGTTGWLFYAPSIPDYVKNACAFKKEVEGLARQLHDIENIAKKYGKTFLFVVAPNKATIYPEFVNLPINTQCNRSRYDLLLEAFSQDPLEGFIRLDLLLKDAKRKQKLYFRTGTHWNYFGADIASQEILKHLLPKTWSNYFPELNFKNEKSIRDLTKMTALNIKEEVQIAETRFPYSKFLTEEQAPLENKHPRYKITATSDLPLLPRTIIYRDSFFSLPLDFLKGAFSQMDIYWTNNLSHPKSIEDLQEARIIILEVVERDLKNLRLSPRRVEVILSMGSVKAGTTEEP